MLSIPNSQLVNSTVASYTNFPHLRVDVAVTVSPAEDIDRIRQLLVATVADNPKYLQDPLPSVQVTDLGDYNISLVLQAWLKDERTHVVERSALREQVFQTLTNAGVDMPFETLSLTPLEIKAS